MTLLHKEHLLASAAGTCDFGVLIGRFQLVTHVHAALFEDALSRSGKLAVLVGSANRPRSVRNPFTFEERAGMITDTVLQIAGEEGVKKLDIRPLPDSLYDDDAWARRVQHIVTTVTSAHIRPSVGLFGCKSDFSSYYLDKFPAWRNLLWAKPPAGDLHATPLRDRYFAGHFDPMSIADLVPAATLDFLQRFRGNEAYVDLMADHKVLIEYREKYGPGPFLTADAVVHNAGRLLRITRGKRPNKGLWALPGGFLEEWRKETLYQCAVRELTEETTIDLGDDPEGVLRNAYRGHMVFDDPNRSERARLITTAFAFDLGGVPKPDVTAADDAGDVDWTQLSDLRADDMFEDHAFITAKMLDFMNTRQH